ncbi:MAG: hypothetical protein K0S80_3185, partial [Neobacillus sp.]|nr:hypothetical protein [Neobacillus sp.]
LPSSGADAPLLPEHAAMIVVKATISKKR